MDAHMIEPCCLRPMDSQDSFPEDFARSGSPHCGLFHEEPGFRSKPFNRRLTIRAHGSRDLPGSFMRKSRRWGISGGFFIGPRPSHAGAPAPIDKEAESATIGRSRKAAEALAAQRRPSGI